MHYHPAAMESGMRAANTTQPNEHAVLPAKPTRPLDSDCCGNDCTLCVFTQYERELERWEEAVAQINKVNPQ